MRMCLAGETVGQRKEPEKKKRVLMRGALEERRRLKQIFQGFRGEILQTEGQTGQATRKRV